MREDPRHQQVQHHRDRVRRNDDASAHPRITSCCSTPRPSSPESERTRPPRLFRRLRPREHRPDIDNDVDEAHSFNLAMEQPGHAEGDHATPSTTPPDQKALTRRTLRSSLATAFRRLHTHDERGASTSFAARRRPTHCHRATANEHGHAPTQKPRAPSNAQLHQRERRSQSSFRPVQQCGTTPPN